MIENPTFMYRTELDHTVVHLTWWIDGEQFTLTKLVWHDPGNDGPRMLMAHQELLAEYTYQVNKRTMQAKHRVYYQVCVDRGWTVQRYRMTSEERAYERLACYRENDELDSWLEVQRVGEWERLEA